MVGGESGTVMKRTSRSSARKNGVKFDPDWHPLSKMFPIIVSEDFAALIESIRQHGLQEPITLFGGQVLDGRNRLRACKDLKIMPKFVHFRGAEEKAREFVIAKNVARRHLSVGQLAVIAAEYLQTLPKAKRGEGKLRERVAKKFGISAGSLATATLVLERDPGGFLAANALRIGEISLAEACQKAAKPIVERVNQQVKAFMRSWGMKDLETADLSVKEYFNGLRRTTLPLLESGLAAAKENKFSPEGLNFFTGWHDKIRAALKAIEDAIAGADPKEAA